MLKGMVAALVVLTVVVGVTAMWHDGAREVVRGVLKFATDPVLLARVERLREPILEASAESGVDPNLIAAIVATESSGHVDAVSRLGALGLMQLMPAAASDASKKLGLPKPTREDLLEDAELNLRLGARHFAWTLANEERDVERALVAYNAGRGRLAQWIRESGSYSAWHSEREAAGDSSVLAYARKVLSYAESFRERGVFAIETETTQSPARGDTHALPPTAHESPPER